MISIPLCGLSADRNPTTGGNIYRRAVNQKGQNTYTPGHEAVSRELGGETPKRIFDMKTFRLTIHRILADGETAVVQHSISAKTRAGEQYENEYCWVYHCRDGKIAKIEEYADTHKAARI